MRKLFLIMLAALSLTGCRYQLDPYANGNNDGARMNINGDKYLLYSDYSASYYNSGSYRLNLSGILDCGLPGRDSFRFTLSVEDSEPFTVGKEYNLLNESVRFEYNNRVFFPTGWLRFTKIDEATGEFSAQFELSSDAFQIKHGFMRVNTHNRRY